MIVFCSFFLSKRYHGKKEEINENQERANKGYEPIHIIGWAQAPYYDKSNKVLHWAKELKFGTEEINTLNYGFDSLGNSEVPLVENCEIDFKDLFKTGTVYFNPIIGFSLKENPFTDVERRFPVEMPFKTDEIYLLSMDIPKGFQVEELPKSEKINLNDNDGIFEYFIDKNPDNIQMRVHIKINKTVFSVNEYPSLRDFYNYIIIKENEQIVFKRIR